MEKTKGETIPISLVRSYGNSDYKDKNPVENHCPCPEGDMTFKKKRKIHALLLSSNILVFEVFTVWQLKLSLGRLLITLIVIRQSSPSLSALISLLPASCTVDDANSYI